MLNISATLFAIDHHKSVALYLSAEGRPFLLHHHTTPGRCFLPSTHLSHALRHIRQTGANDLTMHLELRPTIPGLSLKLPFMAFIGVGEKVVFAYAPAKLTAAEAEPIFETFTDLPVLICDAEEFFVGEQTWLRVVEAGRLRNLQDEGSLHRPKQDGGASVRSEAHSLQATPLKSSGKTPDLDRRTMHSN